MKKDAKIFVTGHTGLVGSAVCRRLAAEGYMNVLTATREWCDLRYGASVMRWIENNEPEYIIHAAGTVGGILANKTYPVDYLCNNSFIHQTVLAAAQKIDVKKLLYLGSSCIYPRDCPQPIKEEYLLTGPLEPTNEAYALAKITGVQSCKYYRRQYGCNFIAAMPTNLYGPGDNFDTDTSHVLPGLIGKFHYAKVLGIREVFIWGSGTPLREFMHVDDLADACLFLMNNYDGEQHINIGTGEEMTITELAFLVRAVVYPEAHLMYEDDKPDGTPRKLLDSSLIHALGWQHRIEIEEGVRQTYEWYKEEHKWIEPAGAH